jgi:hypothetical protein
MINGMGLGDGYLRIRQGCRDAQLDIKQKDRAFVFHIWDLLNSLGIVGSPPVEEKALLDLQGIADYLFLLYLYAALIYHTIPSMVYKQRAKKSRSFLLTLLNS